MSAGGPAGRRRSSSNSTSAVRGSMGGVPVMAAAQATSSSAVLHDLTFTAGQDSCGNGSIATFGFGGPGNNSVTGRNGEWSQGDTASSAAAPLMGFEDQLSLSGKMAPSMRDCTTSRPSMPPPSRGVWMPQNNTSEVSSPGGGAMQHGHQQQYFHHQQHQHHLTNGGYRGSSPGLAKILESGRSNSSAGLDGGTSGSSIFDGKMTKRPTPVTTVHSPVGNGARSNSQQI